MQTIKPLVSIIVAAPDGLEITRRCLESLFHQDYQPLEIILVDNGSPENLARIMAADFRSPVKKSILGYSRPFSNSPPYPPLSPREGERQGPQWVTPSPVTPFPRCGTGDPDHVGAGVTSYERQRYSPSPTCWRGG